VNIGDYNKMAIEKDKEGKMNNNLELLFGKNKLHKLKTRNR
jgi:hypothetical protein